MAPDDAERRGKRRWFRILGSPEAARNEGDERPETEGRVDLMERDAEAAADPVDEAAAGAAPAEEAPALVVTEVPVPEPDGPEVSEDSEPAIAEAGAEDAAPASESPAAEAEPEAEPGPGAAARASGLMDAPEPIVLPRVLAIANQKGGVGKTTTAVNLGAALAELGFRVLVIDLDPQGNATTGLGISHRNVEGSIYDVIMNDVPIEDCVEPTAVKNLFVVPATIDLAGAEIELVPAFSRELKLRRAIQAARDDYDFVMIDCPPSLGLLTVNGLAAADDVIVPIQCEYYALEGLGQLLRNLTLVKTNLNPPLDLRGIVLTMYDARTKLAEQVEKEVRDHFGPKVYRTVVPRTVRISEAPSFGQPVTVFDASSRGALAYRELAKEVSHGATRGPR
jgi:chromosome partitioning protein